MHKGTVFILDHKEFNKNPDDLIDQLIEEMLHNEPEITFVDNGIGQYECHGYVGYDRRIEPFTEDFPKIYAHIHCWVDQLEESQRLFREYMRYSTEFSTENGNIPCEIRYEESSIREAWGYTLQYRLFWEVE